MPSSLVQLVPLAAMLHQQLVGSLWTSFYSWEQQFPLFHHYRAVDLDKHSRSFELNSDKCT